MGYRTNTRSNQFATVPQEALMLTKDENIIEEYKQKTLCYFTRSQKKRNKKAAGRRRWLRKQKERLGNKDR